MSGITTIDTLLFNVRLSIRYHNRRRAFFDGFDLMASGIAVVFSSAAIAALNAESERYAIWSALVVTVFSAIHLVTRSTVRAREHHDLVKRFIALEQSILPATEQDFWELYAAKLAIEADEPPVLANLSIMCHNDQAVAEGYGEERLYHVNFLQRLLSHIADIPPRPRRLTPNIARTPGGDDQGAS
jgi:hypothetical protein